MLRVKRENKAGAAGRCGAPRARRVHAAPKKEWQGKRTLVSESAEPPRGGADGVAGGGDASKIEKKKKTLTRVGVGYPRG